MELFSSGNRLMNHETTVVSESLLSNAITNPSVGVMDFGNVVVRRDYQTYDKVKIISGGGTGHQPAYAGYVGPGMLTAAVHGEPVIGTNVCLKTAFFKCQSVGNFYLIVEKL